MSNGENKSSGSSIPSENPKRVLVAGATGYLGKLVVEACKGEGYWVRALARDPERLGHVKELCDDIFVGHATRNETLEGLCEGIDIAFSSIGFMTFNRQPLIWEVDYEANMNIVRRAKAAGVKHFVYTSTINCEKMSKTVRIAEAKYEVTKELQISGMSWTVLEPTGFFDDIRKLFDMVKKGTAYVFGKGETKFNPIHGIDLANESVRAMKDTSLRNKILPLGGPETFTHKQVAELSFEVLGTPPKFRHVPVWLLKGFAPLIRPFNRNMADMLHFFIAMGSMDMVGNACGNHRLRDFLQTLV